MLQIKNLKLKSNVIQAPLAGFTDLPYRLIAREHGMELGYCEMVSAEAIIRCHKKTTSLLNTSDKDRPVGAQIFGRNPTSMARAAEMIEELGFDVVDLNFACPVQKVTRKGEGAALLKDFKQSELILKAVVKAVKRIPVTLKLRLGYTDESGAEAVHVAKIADACGVSAITVHGRTKAQFYSGKADWEAIGRVKSAVQIPLFGNGDVFSGDDAVRLVKTSGCDGVAIGRGSIGNPWIYREVEAALENKPLPPKPSFKAQKQLLLQYLKLEMETFGERMSIVAMRKVVPWRFKGHPGISKFRHAVNHTNTYEKMRTLIENFEDVEAKTTK